MMGNKVEKHPFYSKNPRSQIATWNNGIKTVMKLKSCEKTKNLTENEDTTDHGHHHGQTVVVTTPVFSYSSLYSMGMLTGGTCGESYG